jgi:hypothetical protein
MLVKLVSSFAPVQRMARSHLRRQRSGKLLEDVRGTWT